MKDLDRLLLAAIRRGARRFNDLEALVNPAGFFARPQLDLSLSRLRRAGLIRLIGDGHRRRYLPTPYRDDDEDPTLRRMEGMVD